MMHGLLPGAILLAANKRARTARQLADAVGAHVDYLREAIEPMVAEAILNESTNGRYRTAFVALDAVDRKALDDLARAAAPDAAQALEACLPRLERAWGETGPLAQGIGWDEAIWQVVGVLVANAGITRQFRSRVEPPAGRLGGPVGGVTCWAATRHRPTAGRSGPPASAM